MTPRAFVRPIAILIATLLNGCGADRPGFAASFGPQLRGAPVSDRRVRAYEIVVQVVDSEHAKLEEIDVPSVTCREGSIVPGWPDAEHGRRYVYATLRLADQHGWWIRKCAVRVRNGPLAGATIWIGGSGFASVPSIKSTLRACYEIPDGLEVPLGRLDHEVVVFHAK